ncbi:MAG: RibD family protein [Gammaproteobacteria bacterium]
MRESAGSAELEGWSLAYAAAGLAGTFDPTVAGGFLLGADGSLNPGAVDDPRAALAWDPSNGWTCPIRANDPRRDLLELYLPISSAGPDRPITLGHLGQSLDGFIATPSGDSCFVTGPQNILHLHRLRALCDAVVVGSRTVQSDNPRLTTRLVAGRNPLRVVLDPDCRLPGTHRVFSDGEAQTLRVCADGAVTPSARNGTAEIITVTARDGTLDLADLVRQLQARGCYRIFVEGGGVTVSSFLEAGLLDRLHIAVAPILIGEGRPAIRIPAQVRLQDCMKLHQRVYRTGNDILFDCDLRATAVHRSHANGPASAEHVERIL